MNNRYKTLRKEKKYTQMQLADLLFIDQTTVSKWELGKATPDYTTLKKLSELYSVSIDYLLGNTDIPVLRVMSDEEHEKNIHKVGYDLSHTGRVPVFSSIIAGYPIEAQTDIIDYISIDYPNPQDYFAIRVKGDSMINEGITDGCYVILHKQQSANNGQIVAALLNGETTIKKIKNNGTVMLIPANPNYMPIIVNPSDDFCILGVLVEIRTKPRL